MLRILSCAKQVHSQCSACLASVRKCTSERCGSKRRIHWLLCEGGTLGKLALQVTSDEPSLVTLPFKGNHSPAGCEMTVALSSSASKKDCHCGA